MNYRLYNDTLCLEIWDKRGETYEMKSEIREKLLQIANDFVEEQLKENEVNIKIQDVVAIGSITNYNWTPYSDIDLHIVVDFAELDMSEEQATLMFSAIKASWNKSHDIKIKGHDVEVYVQGTTEKNSSQSDYSVMNGKWLRPPVKNKPSIDKEHIKKKHAELKTRIDQCLNDVDEDGLRKILEKLYTIRQAGLDKKGEFSEENIVFKILRAQGYLDKIKDAANKLYDKEMTINELALNPTHYNDRPEDREKYKLHIGLMTSRVLQQLFTQGTFPSNYDRNLQQISDYHQVKPIIVATDLSRLCLDIIAEKMHEEGISIEDKEVVSILRALVAKSGNSLSKVVSYLAQEINRLERHKSVDEISDREVSKYDSNLYKIAKQISDFVDEHGRFPEEYKKVIWSISDTHARSPLVVTKDLFDAIKTLRKKRT